MADQPPPRAGTQGLNGSAILVAATAITIVNLFILTWVTREGWLAGSAFPRPLGMRLLIYGALNMTFVIVPLGLYQWLAARSAARALAVYSGFVVAFSLGSIPVLNQWLARGVFVFAGPYSTAWDVAWGAVQYCAALGICEVVSRLARNH